VKGGRTKRAKAIEPFSRLPWRITDALRRGRLTFNEHGVLTFLVPTIEREEGELVITLRSLADLLNWTASTEALRQTLRNLAAANWITVDVVPGGRKWTIGLAVARVREDTDDTDESRPPRDLHGRLQGDLQAESPSEFEVSSNAAESATVERSLTEWDRNPFLAPSGDGPSETETEFRSTDWRENAANAASRQRVGQNLQTPAATEEALHFLVDFLDDADDRTFLTFKRNFGDLSAQDFLYTLDQMEKRRQGWRGHEPPESEVRYAYAILENILYGYSGPPRNDPR
jgi:hypothetical protein